MEVRLATIQDIDQIATLFIEQFDIQATLNPYLMQRGTQNLKFIEDTIINEDSDIFVASVADKVIGFISVFEKKSNDFNFMVQHRYAYLMDIIVTKGQQGKGHATKLMDAAKQWAKNRNLDYIELSVFASNEAVNFYTKSGYVETGKTMIYKLQ